MTAYIGLTKAFWNKYEAIRQILLSLGIQTIHEAERVCNESELRTLRMGMRVANNPDINLWNQSYQTL